MKKLILLLVVALGAATLTAQDVKRNGANGVSLPETTFLFSYTGVTSDTVTTNQDSLTVAWFINKPISQFYDVQVVLNETTAGGKAAVSWQGKKFASQAWSNITTVNYAATLSTGADTTIYFAEGSTKQFYNYYRVLVKYTAAKTKLKSISGVLKN